MDTTASDSTYDHFNILRNEAGQLWELGRGGMGVTYRAIDTRLDTEVVIKKPHTTTLNEQRTRRFLREARAAAKIRHPNVGSVIYLSEDPLYYVMEYVDGQTLTSLLKKEQRVSPSKTIYIIEQVTLALNALSRHSVVHRDIKPSNIMLLADADAPHEFRVKLIDFGLVKAGVPLDPLSISSTAISIEGEFLGTPEYASPEQCQCLDDLDVRSDLYSLGAVMWTLLTGSPPFSGNSGQLIAQHLGKDPDWSMLDGAPPQLVTVLQKLLQKDRTQRFQSPIELRSALRPHLAAPEGLIPESATIAVEMSTAPNRYNDIAAKSYTSARSHATNGNPTALSALRRGAQQQALGEVIEWRKQNERKIVGE